MKKMTIVFMVLLVAFCGTWIFKMKSPVNRPQDANATQNSPWWDNTDFPEADPEWILDPEIPANYIPVPGSIELYMVIDENGEIIKYRERTKQEDGSWVWKDVNPDIPDDYEPVPGLENVYKVTNKDGTVSYYKYIRNDDDTFAFVPVDEKGNPLKTEEEEKEDPNAIPKNYVRIKDTNIYGVYNEHGVCIGYKERRFDAKTGNYYWVDAEKPVDTDQDATKPTKPSEPTDNNHNPSVPTYPIVTPSQPTSSTTPNNPTTPSTPQNYTFTEVITSTEVKGGWVITYETTITKVYSPTGELISTKKDGPKEVSRVQASENTDNVPDPSKIAATLREEYARVSVGLVYKDDMVEQVLQVINTERATAGKPIFVLDKNSDAYLLAAIKASDMAIYNHSDFDSPMYGTAGDLCDRYKIAVKDISDIQWKAYNATAEEIARRLYLLHGNALTNENYSDIGLSIVAKGAYYYIDLILIQK